MTKKRRTPQAQSPVTDLTCQQVIALLVEYIAEDMDPQTRTAFEAHLRDCPECVAFLATYKETIRATRAMRYEAIPEAMLTRVLRFLRRKIEETPRHRGTACGATKACGRGK
jgi:anti-sigma factor RsiW